MIPRWFLQVTEQACTFSLILAHSSTNILWNFETLSIRVLLAGFRPWSVAYQAYLNQHQREAPSPNHGAHRSLPCRMGMQLHGCHGRASSWSCWVMPQLANPAFCCVFCTTSSLKKSHLVMKTQIWNWWFCSMPPTQTFYISISFSMHMFFIYHKDHLSCKFSVFQCLFVCGFQETTVGAAFNTKTIESRGRQVGHGLIPLRVEGNLCNSWNLHCATWFRMSFCIFASLLWKYWVKNWPFVGL